MSEVKLVNISKAYNNAIPAVKNVNLTINDKEFIVLVGPSGCGKSTTLRMIAGLEEISSGELYIDSILVNDVPPKDRDIAMVFQNYALYPHLTVYENLAFGLKLRKFDKKEISERVLEAAKILGIEELLNRKPKALSGGQRQRVAVGRAIVRKPKLFLFDEPLSNLDAKLRVQMRTEISKLHLRLGATIVYVTHDQTEAMTMGDFIAVMDKGEVQQFDSPLNLYNYPKNKFVAGFIGNPAMNFINGTIVNDNGFKFKDESNSIILNLNLAKYEKISGFAGKKVIMGIRPEDIVYQNLSGSPDFESFKTKIDIVELLGNEIFVYFNIGGKQCVARMPVNEDLKSGKETKLNLDKSKFHFFNAADEKSILIT